MASAAPDCTSRFVPGGGPAGRACRGAAPRPTFRLRGGAAPRIEMMTPWTPLRPLALAATLWLAAAAPAQSQGAPSPAPVVPLEEPGFTDALTEQFRSALPDEHVVVAGPQRLTIGNSGAVVSLARLWQACHAAPAGCDAQAAAFVAGATRTWQAMNKPPERAQVRLALRSAASAQANLARSRGTGLNLQVQPFVGGLVSAVVIDTPAALRWASGRDLDALKLDAAGLRELARSNTHAAMQPLASVAPPAPKGKIGAIDGDDAYIASRLLFPADWAPLAKAQGGVLVVAAPRPGTLLYVGDDDATSLAALRTFAHKRGQGAPDALGDLLLRWTPEGWKPLP